MHFQAFSKGNLSFHLNNVHFKDKEFMCRMCHFKTAYKGEYLDQLRSTFRVRREGYLCRAEPFKLVPPFVIFFLLFIRFFLPSAHVITGNARRMHLANRAL